MYLINYRYYITNFIAVKKISFAQFAIGHIIPKVVCKPIIDKCIWRQIQTIRLCASIAHSSASPDMNWWYIGNEKIMLLWGIFIIIIIISLFTFNQLFVFTFQERNPCWRHVRWKMFRMQFEFPNFDGTKTPYNFRTQ